ncbi:putative MFS family arabinose efflux permease [Herbihabitans rhizosphaerae]|uniref:Putative MFS family arabinose efflux permease n=1 Tax=Herbihabitans rhizosphaerae TaxID=1872711 RepID=A0A4Q7KKS6_9PSEU|nr:MFS transporter [Herbihabitans rhizosphaerae]RZS36490.1 putative MFS family arabinose efflux permease [Herbihabitans rhizosphaerae]
MRRALLDVTPLRTSPKYRRLWIGQLCSGIGSQMTLVAVLFQIWQTTHSPAWTGAVGLAAAVPVIVFGLLAGSLVDRTDRRVFYLRATAGEAVCSLLLAAQGFLGPAPAIGVLALVAAQATFVAGAGPAARTFVPRLLPPEQLGAGLALNRIAFSTAMLAGPALGGLIVGWLGVGACYLIDAVTFTIALACARGLPSLRPDGGSSRAGLGGVLDGLAFLGREPAVRAALLTDLAAMVLAMPISLFPLVNAERFGGDPRTLGLFLSAIAVGGAVATVFSGSVARSVRPGALMLAGSLGWGVSIALFGIVPDPVVALGFLIMAGAADTIAVICRGLVVQRHTPDAMLGRAVSAEQIVGQAGPEIGNLRGGLVAGATSGTTALVSGGLLCAGAVVLIAVTNRRVLRSSNER